MDETYTTSLQVRFRDIDPLYHVSHTVYVVYMQQARLSFFDEVLEHRKSEYNTVVVHLEIDYEKEISVGDEVTVDACITAIGTSSFTMAYTILADGTRVAAGESVQVVTHEDTGKPTEIPSAWREVLDCYRTSGERQGSS